jgi:hypothetical protein
LWLAALESRQLCRIPVISIIHEGITHRLCDRCGLFVTSLFFEMFLIGISINGSLLHGIAEAARLPATME